MKEKAEKEAKAFAEKPIKDKIKTQDKKEIKEEEISPNVNILYLYICIYCVVTCNIYICF